MKKDRTNLILGIIGLIFIAIGFLIKRNNLNNIFFKDWLFILIGIILLIIAFISYIEIGKRVR